MRILKWEWTPDWGKIVKGVLLSLLLGWIEQRLFDAAGAAMTSPTTFWILASMLTFAAIAGLSPRQDRREIVATVGEMIGGSGPDGKPWLILFLWVKNRGAPIVPVLWQMEVQLPTSHDWIPLTTNVGVIQGLVAPNGERALYSVDAEINRRTVRGLQKGAIVDGYLTGISERLTEKVLRESNFKIRVVCSDAWDTRHVVCTTDVTPERLASNYGTFPVMPTVVPRRSEAKSVARPAVPVVTAPSNAATPPQPAELPRSEGEGGKE